MKAFKKESIKPQDKNCYETPRPFFEKLNSIFNFNYDLCADELNSKCNNYFSKEENSLTKDWHKLEGWQWINPPYGKPYIEQFIKKCRSERNLGAKVVVLVPLETITTKYYAENKADFVIFISGRIQFEYRGDTVKGNRGTNVILIYDRLFSAGKLLDGNECSFAESEHDELYWTSAK